MNRLTVRLLTAFAFVLIMTLAFSTFALLVVLRSRPADLDAEYLELAATALDINYREGLNTGLNNTFRQQLLEGQPLNDAIVSVLVANLDSQAEAFDVRLLVVEEGNTVRFDTAGIADNITGNISRERFIESERPTNIEGILGKGTFIDNGQEWYFVEQPFLSARVAGMGRIGQRGVGPMAFDRVTDYTLLVAQPVPQQTVSTVIEDAAGNGIFLATVQAGAIGMGFAFLVSLWLVRWISRPLLHIADGAARVAEGDYATRVPVEGPTETKLVAQSFNNMASRVEITQKAQRDFLANVSHDLRTPLTSIQGFAQAIMEGVGDPKLAEIIHEESSRLTRMVNELLDLARIQAGRMDMMRQSVEIDTLLKTITNNLSMKAQESDIDLHVDVTDLPRIAGDGDRLAQVFTNLLDNAIKHTPQGGEVSVRAQIDSVQHGIVVHIQDTGEGIPHEDLNRIFERFYQVDKSRTRNAGSGLGLAITYEIVQAHNGRIWVESDYGRGAQFNVWLPQPISDSGKTAVMPRSAPA